MTTPLELDVFALVSAAAAVTAIAGTRVYPLELPTDPELPAVTYRVVSAVADPTLDTAGTRKYRLQFDCYAVSYLAAVTLRGAVVETLDGTPQGPILDCWLCAKAEFFDDAPRQYRATVEFYVLANS